MASLQSSPVAAVLTVGMTALTLLYRSFSFFGAHCIMQVSNSFVREVAQNDATGRLKLAAHLKQRHLDPSHYEKMSVALALAVTGSAIRTLEKEPMMSLYAITTAWFLETVLYNQPCVE